VLFVKETKGYLPIPYDFDFSGLVNATYAEPNPKLPIKKVTRRLYRGMCEHNAHVEAALATFREKEAAIRELVTSMEALDEGMRKEALKFIDRFYKDTATPESVDRSLIRRCLS
jgi:hypothetical protein